MEELSIDTLLDFQSISKYDIQYYFEKYIDFIDNYLFNIINFYGGETDNEDELSFSKFNELKEDTKNVIELFSIHAEQLTSYDFWILKEQIEDIQHQSEILSNFPKYARTTLINGSYKGNVRLDYTRSQNQTLENIQSNIAGSSNAENDWSTLAIDNNLQEEDYSKQGGALIKVNINQNNNLVLQSVAKGISKAEDTYGIDICKDLKFIDSNLQILTEEETLKQSAYILLNKLKDDEKLLLGITESAFSYPLLIRKISEHFATDDSFTSIQIDDIYKDQDAVMIDISIFTVAGQIINETIQI